MSFVVIQVFIKNNSINSENFLSLLYGYTVYSKLKITNRVEFSSFFELSMLKEIWLEFPLKILNGSSDLRGSELKKRKILEYFFTSHTLSLTF